MGPIAAPAEKAEIQRPIALDLSLGSLNMLKIKDSVDGPRVAPPIPRRARETISISGVFENAAIIENKPKTEDPSIKSFLLPILSPRVPIVTRNPATIKP